MSVRLAPKYFTVRLAAVVCAAIVSFVPAPLPPARPPSVSFIRLSSAAFHKPSSATLSLAPCAGLFILFLVTLSLLFFFPCPAHPLDRSVQVNQVQYCRMCYAYGLHCALVHLLPPVGPWSTPLYRSYHFPTYSPDPPCRPPPCWWSAPFPRQPVTRPHSPLRLVAASSPEIAPIGPHLPFPRFTC